MEENLEINLGARIVRPAQSPLIFHTRLGNPIGNTRGRNLNPTELFQAAEQLKVLCARRGLDFNRLILRRGPTYRYNCHGLTFLSRRANLLEDDEIQRVLDDDGYSEVTPAELLAGDVALYWHRGKIAHSGIILRPRVGYPGLPPPMDSQESPLVLSKWGRQGEFIHWEPWCPYDHERVSYWREGMR